MSYSATPEHARVRVGPLSAGTLVAGWPQSGDCGCGRCRCGHAVTGTLLAADDRGPARWLETADVIIAVGEAGGTGPGEWLRRYPGCSVAAAMTRRGECSVATRDDVLRSVAVSGQESGAGVLACAVFVYGWLAAGWSLTLLRPARLYVSYGGDVTQRLGGPLFFRFGYCSSSGDPSGPPAGPDSAARTCSASGAPSAS